MSHKNLALTCWAPVSAATIAASPALRMVALVLNWTRGIALADRQVRAGRWDPAGARARRLSALTGQPARFPCNGPLTTATRGDR